jgi:cytochrome c-type protein NapB
MKGSKIPVLLIALVLIVAAGLLAFATTNHQVAASAKVAPAVAQTGAQNAQSGGGDGIRSEDPLQSGSAELPPVSTAAPPPGAAKPMPRSFENAPPQIPHSIEGLVPITLTNNACLGCHAPEVAQTVGATPIPPTHLKIDLFSKSENKKMVVDPSRYNCTLCHVPQANVQPPVVNVFKPDFRNPEARERSTLFEQWDEGAE